MHGGQGLILAAGFQCRFEFDTMIKMIFDGGFIATCHEDKFFYAGFDGLFNSILNEWLVNDWQHFFGKRLGCWQKPCAKSADRKNGFFNHVLSFLPIHN